MKKILHITGAMNVGGTETMLMSLYRQMHQIYQFDFISYSEKEAYYDEEIVSLGGTVIRLTPSTQVGMRRAINELCNVIKQNGPYEAVHAHTLFHCGIAMIAAKRCGVKVRISHSHTTANPTNSVIKQVYQSVMTNTIQNFATNYLACSESAGMYLFGQNVKKKESFEILPNYIDYQSFIYRNEVSDIRKELQLDEGALLIAHVGRLVEPKNHLFLLDIISALAVKLPKVHAIFIGDGDQRSLIEQRIGELNLQNNVTLLGWREDVNTLLKESDVFVFPSIYEGLGLVMLEAQACGLPCVVSKAIQKEANLELGLVHQLNLDEGAEIWSEKIMNVTGHKTQDKVRIEEAFISRGYRIEDIIYRLQEIYEGK